MEDHERKRCGAKRRDGLPCQKPPVPGRDRCRLHGGATPRGAASPHYRGRGYSRFLPSGLAELYHEALNDPELLSCRSELALLELRTAELAKKFYGGETGLWKQSRKALHQFKEAYKGDPNSEETRAALAKLTQLAEEGAADEAAWREMVSAIETKSRVAEREGKRLQVMQQYFTAEDGVMLVDALVQAVEAEVPDPEIRRRIGERLTRLLYLRRNSQAVGYLSADWDQA